jgi:photosystem II stability/assembly factor-like uncharacterized protein
MLVTSLAILLFGAGVVRAQWTMQESHTTADLRGIHNVGGGVAWASGTNGTVLRTLDGGATWAACAVPPDAEKLDFRGVQAFDASTAIVMSSGKGDLSRLYKTTDGCKSRKLVFTNPDEDGFFDAIHAASDGKIYVLGDPVRNVFAIFFSEDHGDTWFAAGEQGRDVHAGETSFAASNSEITEFGEYLLFGTGGVVTAHAYVTGVTCSPPPGHPNGPAITNCTVGWKRSEVPVGNGTSTSGIFSLSASTYTTKQGVLAALVVAVGGQYDHLDEQSDTAAVSADGGRSWSPSATMPHGYRSAVAYDAGLKTWITVGPNGTDISTDDGRNWRAAQPNAELHEAPDADRNWNALSLPFVVGPHGRIGKLNSEAITRLNNGK